MNINWQTISYGAAEKNWTSDPTLTKGVLYHWATRAFIFNPFGEWAELDLNQRRLSQRIYSPPPLTTRASTLVLTPTDNNTKNIYCNSFVKKNNLLTLKWKISSC